MKLLAHESFLIWVSALGGGIVSAYTVFSGNVELGLALFGASAAVSNLGWINAIDIILEEKEK